MEKAILKTLAYADLFDYPLKINEVQRWLVGRKASLRQVAKALSKLHKVSSIKYKGRYYFLPKRNEIVSQRRWRRKQSEIYFRKAKILSQILKAVPWIRLVGISGGLALDNASKKDDIDLFIITTRNRLWISRLLILGLLSLTGQRRKRADYGKKISGKLCINTLLEEDKLEQTNKDIFVAHEILQMRPLWYKGKIYEKYLSDNEWVFKFLPNWITDARGPARRASSIASLLRLRAGIPSSPSPLAALLDNLARWFQLKIMSKPKGMERIEDGALYFHPTDYRPEILSKYQEKIKKIISP